jgi:hypothetical protein
MKTPYYRWPQAIVLTLGLVAADSGFAKGYTVITQCRTSNTQDAHSSQISVSWKESVDAGSPTGVFEARYEGTIGWDAKPDYSLKGSLAATLPLSNSPVPSLPRNFSITDGTSFVSRVQAVETGTPAPSKERHMVFKVPASGAYQGFDTRYALLKLNLPLTAQTQFPAFGDLYITDKPESHATPPEGGTSVIFLCSQVSQVVDATPTQSH